MNYFALSTGTIAILALSWFTSVKHKRYHGISRFFAFESVFILFLLNYRFWFKDPFSVNQVFSWLLLTVSAYTVLAGFILLREKGRSLGSFENTTVIISTGIYKYIRHPMYCSVLLLGTGIVLKNPDTAQLLLGCSNLLAVFLTARIEEKEGN